MKLQRFSKAVIFIIVAMISVDAMSQTFQPALVQGRWDSESTANSFYELEPNSLEVAAIGSSVCAAGVDPCQLYEEQGILAYNLAIISEPMIGTYYWLKELYKTQSPKVVIIEIQIAARKRPKKEEKFRRCFDYMKNSLNKFEFALAYCKSNKEADILDYVFPLSIFHWRWGELGKEDIQENLAPARGFNALVKKSGIEFYGTNMSGNELPKKYSKTDYDYLKQNIELCRENGSEVVLLKAPDSTWTVEKHNLIEKRAKEMNVTFIDYSEKENYKKLKLDWKTDANDEQHLNVLGAEKFTKAIGVYLKETFALTDYREKEKYHIDLTPYKRYIKEAKELIKK